MRRIWLTLLCALQLTACNTAPKDLNWANSDNPVVDAWAPPILAINSTARVDKKDPVPTSSERAAAARIIEIGRKTKTLKAFKEETAAPDKAPSLQLDWRKLTRTLSVSVQRPTLRTGDRYLRYTVDIRPMNFIFSDIKSVSTVYQSVDLGSLESKSEVDAGLKLDPTFAGGLVGTGEVSATHSDTSDRTRKIAVRVQDPDIEATPTRILILREGAPDRDITGTTTSDLSVDPPDDRNVAYGRVVKSLKISTSAALLKPGKAEVTVSTYEYLQPRGLEVCAQLTYYEWIVKAGRQHQDPAQQTVEPFAAKQLPWTPFIIVQPNEMAPELWGILDRRSGEYVELDDLQGGGAISFADPVQADQFLHWVNAEHTEKIGKARLRLPPLGGNQPTMAAAQLIVEPVLRAPITSSPYPADCDRFMNDAPSVPGPPAPGSGR